MDLLNFYVQLRIIDLKKIIFILLKRYFYISFPFFKYTQIFELEKRQKIPGMILLYCRVIRVDV